MELAQLPSEEELNQYAMKKRAQQQELDDLNQKIKELETKLEQEDEEELDRQIREFQQENAELEAELEEMEEMEEQSKPLTDSPTNPPIDENSEVKMKTEKVWLNFYRTSTLMYTTHNSQGI